MTQKTHPYVEQSRTIGAIGRKELENAQRADDSLKKLFESANQKVFGKDDNSSIEGYTFLKQMECKGCQVE